jgi:hypothetical protein
MSRLLRSRLCPDGGPLSVGGFAERAAVGTRLTHTARTAMAVRVRVHNCSWVSGRQQT